MSTTWIHELRCEQRCEWEAERLTTASCPLREKPEFFFGNRLNFLYGRTELPYRFMHEWLKVPEFADAMLERYERREHISEMDIFSTMRWSLPLLCPMDTTFDYHLLALGLKWLKRSLNSRGFSTW